MFSVIITLEPLDENTVTFKAKVQVSPTFLGRCCSFGDMKEYIDPFMGKPVEES